MLLVGKDEQDEETNAVVEQHGAHDGKARGESHISTHIGVLLVSKPLLVVH